MEPTPDRRRWPRLTLTLPPEASDKLDTLARVNMRDRKREALRLLLDSLERAGNTR
jgi:predicted transcriptional regulator